MKNRILLCITALMLTAAPAVVYAGTGALSGACYPAIDCDPGDDAYGAGAACRKAINTVADCAAAGYPATSNSFSCSSGCYKASAGSGGPTCPTVTFTSVDDDDDVSTPPVTIVVPSLNLVDYNSATQIFNCATKVVKPYWSSGTTKNTLYTNGHVGIGTNNPSAAALQIVNSGSGANLVHKIGVQADVTESTAGVFNNSAYGLFGAITDSGSGSAIGLYPWLVTDNDAGSAYVLYGTGRDNGANDAYGAYLSAQNNDAGDAYGIRVDSQNNSTGREFGLYVVGDDNYLSGNLGVGTATPGYKVDVQGDNNALHLGGTGSWTSGAKLNFGDSNYVYIGEDADDQLTIKGDKVVKITGTNSIGGRGELQVPGGTAGSAVTHFNYSGDGKNYIRGTTVMADNGGNVGIGTTTPGNKLEVAGSGYVTGNFTADGWIDSNSSLYLNGSIYDEDDNDVNIGDSLFATGTIRSNGQIGGFYRKSNFYYNLKTKTTAVDGDELNWGSTNSPYLYTLWTPSCNGSDHAVSVNDGDFHWSGAGDVSKVGIVGIYMGTNQGAILINDRDRVLSDYQVTVTCFDPNVDSSDVNYNV